MRLRLKQGPEGAPNFCFGLYTVNSTLSRDGYRRGACVLFVQSDWDYAGLASSLGWCPCECGATDGTVDCRHRTVSEMLSEAFDFLAEHDGEVLDLSEF